jgi:hypothetical protein
MLFFREDFSSSAPLRLCVKTPFGCGSVALGESAVKKETPPNKSAVS